MAKTKEKAVKWQNYDGPGFHGDMVIIPAKLLSEGPPAGAKEAQAEPEGFHILTHSETGHHHVTQSEGVSYFPVDEFNAWMRVDAPTATIWHTKESGSKHQAQELLGGGSWYKIQRGRESTPTGLRRVID